MTEITNPTEELMEEPQAEISTTSVQYQNTQEVLARLKQIAETKEADCRKQGGINPSRTRPAEECVLQTSQARY